MAQDAPRYSSPSVRRGVVKGRRLPVAPQQGWISDGRHVIHFQPLRYNRWNQTLEVTFGEWIPGEPAPLLKRRQQLTRDEALKLWAGKRQQGWSICPLQWTPPAPLKPPAPRLQESSWW